VVRRRKATHHTAHNGTTDGQLITQPITEPQTAVDVSGFPSGVYFVKVVDDRMVRMGKVVRE
jgi:hypothetical protein